MMPPLGDSDGNAILREQINIELQAGEKYYSNNLHHLALRRFDEANDLFQRLPAAEQAKLSEIEAKIISSRAHLFLLIDNPQMALEIAGELLKRDDLLPFCDLMDMFFTLGTAAYFVGEFGIACEHLEKAIQRFEESEEEQEEESLLQKVGNAIFTKGMAHLHQLSFFRAIEELYDARDTFLQLNNLSHLADCDLVLGELALYMKEFRNAEYHISTVNELLSGDYLPLKKALALRLKGLFSNEAGLLPETLSHLESAYRLFREHQFLKPALRVLLELSEIAMEYGYFNRATDYLLEAEDICSSFTEAYYEKIELMLVKFSIKARIQGAVQSVNESFRDLIRLLRDHNHGFMLHRTVLKMLEMELFSGSENSTLNLEYLHELRSFWDTLHRDPYPLEPLIQAFINHQQEQTNDSIETLKRGIATLPLFGWEQFHVRYHLFLATLYAHELHDESAAEKHYSQATLLCGDDAVLLKDNFNRSVLDQFPDDVHQEYLGFLCRESRVDSFFNAFEEMVNLGIRKQLGNDLGHRLIPKVMTMAMQQHWDELRRVSRELLCVEAALEWRRPYDFEPRMVVYSRMEDFNKDAWTNIKAASDEAELLSQRKQLLKAKKSISHRIIAEDERWRLILGELTWDAKKMLGDFDKKTAVVIMGNTTDICMFALAYRGQVKALKAFPAAAGTILELIESYLDSLVHGKDVSRYSNRLWDVILDPVLQQVPEKCRRLIIIPFGQFWKVPFHLLQKEGKCLWDHFLIDYAPSLRLLQEADTVASQRHHTESTILVLSPAGSAEQLIDPGQLESLKKEKKFRDKIIIRTPPLSRKLMLPGIQRANVVVLGAPFQLNESAPRFSGIELSGLDDDRSKWFSIDDLMEQRFDDTDLMIFSSTVVHHAKSRGMPLVPLLFQVCLHTRVPSLAFGAWKADPMALSLYLKNLLQFRTRGPLNRAYREAAFALRASGQFFNERDWAPLMFVGHGGGYGKTAGSSLFSRRKK